jgi:hypothetical protein
MPVKMVIIVFLLMIHNGMHGMNTMLCLSRFSLLICLDVLSSGERLNCDFTVYKYVIQYMEEVSGWLNFPDC